MTQKETSIFNFCTNLLEKFRCSRRLILLIVAVALLLDNMLLSTVVPIIPDFLHRLEHNDTVVLYEETTVTMETTTVANSCNQDRGYPTILPVNLETTTTVDETTVISRKEVRHMQLLNENVEVGVMFASKPVVQAITNPFVGPLTNRIGYSIPMFSGFVIMFLSTVILQLVVLKPRVMKETQEGTSLFTLVKDPYILIAAGALAFANMGISSLEPSLPLWMMDTMSAPEWQQGAAFLPASISYLIGTNIFGPMGHKMGRWLATLVGLIIIGTCVVCIPMAKTFNHLILPNAGIGFAIGMVDSSMMPMLGYLVDVRHTSVYGSVYAIGDVALCVGFTFGPLLSSAIVNTLGFQGLVYTTGVICFLYAPLLLLLRKVPAKDENQFLLNDTTIRYISYTNEDSPEEEKPVKEWVKILGGLLGKDKNVPSTIEQLFLVDKMVGEVKITMATIVANELVEKDEVTNAIIQTEAASDGDEINCNQRNGPLSSVKMYSALACGSFSRKMVIGICTTVFERLRSRRVILFTVATAILLDNILSMIIVPIMPDYLYKLQHNDTDVFPEYNATMAMESCKHNDSCINRNILINSETKANNGDSIKEDREKMKHSQLIQENTELGIMFASKFVVQIITNYFVILLINRMGYSVPIFIGLITILLSTIIYAIGKSYFILFFSRSLHGVGSAFINTAGMGMLAKIYPDDKERGNAMSIALNGVGLGMLIGPALGGITYQFMGKAFPFWILTAVISVEELLQVITIPPKLSREVKTNTSSIVSLIKDPYIIIATGSLTVSNMVLSALEPSLPVWMMEKMNAPEWQQGVTFSPPGVLYLIGTCVFGRLGHKFGRWLVATVGLILTGISAICIPMVTTFELLIPPCAGVGFGIGLVESSMFPMLGDIMDVRHTSIYSDVYAFADIALCASLILGPLLSSAIVYYLGFTGLVYILGGMCIVYAFPLMLLRKFTSKPENQDREPSKE
ncbi:synaptic vesicular amine transporter-like [Centruroides sculpturatus]|uniref:synaptic vesicular amine transporter-like n=1 Tax=Centruroides sculpturatus TaxID=218467 RepID=UPI000C6EF961|nr:synaptic vesicular amine transporter-like [Centruroides sculpturatus]